MKSFVKSISPIIGTILLIIIAVILVTIILNWGKDFVSSELKPADVSNFNSCDYDLSIKTSVISKNNLDVRNLYKESLTLTGYSIISFNDSNNLNKKISIDPINIDSGRSSILEVVCFPEKEFTLELYFSDNCIIPKKIIVQDYNVLDCSIVEEEEEEEVIEVPEGVGENPENGQIWYLEHLRYIETDESTADGNYVLMRSLDFDDDNSYYDSVTNKSSWTTGDGWVPLGGITGHPFSGEFDGNNFIINNLYVNNSTPVYTGFFGIILPNAIIKNLELKDVNINSSVDHTGGIAGLIEPNVSIINCSVSGVIFSSTDYVGGIIGLYGNNTGDPLIEDVTFDGIIHGKDYIGGVAGLFTGGGDLINLNISTTINSTGDFVGGIVGLIENINNTNNIDVSGIINVVGTPDNINYCYGYSDNPMYDCTSDVVINYNQ